MNMDDQFLQQLRRDPPAGFATRLKWQLDRPAPAPASRARLLLVFAIFFGTAFALVSPTARHALGALFDSDKAQPTATPPAAVSGASGRIERPRALPPPRFGATPANSPKPQSLPAQAPADAPPLSPEAPAMAETSGRYNSVISTNVGPQSPQQGAAAAVETRKGLFRILGWVVAPLAAMRVEQIPLDMHRARTNADRLTELSSLIPEVFRANTQGFELNTRALDRIWAQPGEFESRQAALTLAATELDRAIADNDQAATLAAIGRVEMACNACHDGYRRN
ncbi:MAG TPA: cytochrome c [Steroidobacteraceae bacterium]